MPRVIEGHYWRLLAQDGLGLAVHGIALLLPGHPARPFDELLILRIVPAGQEGNTVDLGGVNIGDITVNPNGNSSAFSNVPPQLGMRYCMAVQGLYPPRP